MGSKQYIVRLNIFIKLYRDTKNKYILVDILTCTPPLMFHFNLVQFLINVYKLIYQPFLNVPPARQGIAYYYKVNNME